MRGFPKIFSDCTGNSGGVVDRLDCRQSVLQKNNASLKENEAN